MDSYTKIILDNKLPYPKSITTFGIPDIYDSNLLTKIHSIQLRFCIGLLIKYNILNIDICNQLQKYIKCNNPILNECLNCGCNNQQLCKCDICSKSGCNYIEKSLSYLELLKIKKI